jgi:3-deoxy-D-manno-octulosonic-acid transferase
MVAPAATMPSVKQRLARAGYNGLLRALTPLYVARLWWRGRVEPLYRHAVGERLGTYSGAPSAGWVWVHAVSLGETRAAAALVAALRQRQPDLRLLLTHGTATGRAAGAELLGPDDRQVWLPYDTPGVVRRFFAQFRPAVGVLMETEVWPNLLLAAQEAGVPMVLANARLSDKSLRQAHRLHAVLRPAIESFAAVLAQTEADAVRLRQAGAPHVQVLGNLKFDMAPDAHLLARGAQWRALSAAPVVLAASTREGEETPLLQAWSALPAPRPRLLLVPRHPQRFDEVAQLVQKQGLALSRRSAWQAHVPGADGLAADVWLGDSMGEMPAYYAAADAALLGGSFAPLGGQNLIEAAACGCPVVMGPHTFNFELAAELSIAAGAALRVAGLDEGVQAAARLASDAAAHGVMAERALAFAAAHRGAAGRIAEAVLSAARLSSARSAG